MSKPEIQTRAQLAEDYKNTLQGLIPICEKYIEVTAQLQGQILQMQSLFIQLKSQAKQMIEGLDEQSKLEEKPQAVRIPEPSVKRG